jgi:hypothetical protein
MSSLEEQLKQSLARREPPTGFAARVMARVEAQPHRPAWWRFFPIPPRRILATALAAAMLVTVGIQYQRHRQGELAKERLVLALQIASDQLHHVQQQILKETP